MDNLKKYLQQNRDKMDVDTPRDFVWQNIRQHSSKKIVKKGVLLRYAVAATVLALVVLSVKWMTNSGNPSVIPVEVVTAKTVLPTLIDSSTTIPVNTLQVNPNTAQMNTARILNRKTRTGGTYELLNAIGKSYAEVVKLQMQSIRTTAMYAEEPGYFNGFKTELQQMDLVEAAIRGSIKVNGPDDILIEQLINVYQHKLDLLKTFRAEINKMNDRAKQYRSPADSSQTYYLDI